MSWIRTLSWIDGVWYGNAQNPSAAARSRSQGIAALLLLPLAAIYGAVIAVRRLFFKRFAPQPLAVPVIVVGNLTVGGTGKTPLVIHLAGELKRRGRKVGIVSRGYRARCARFPRLVKADDDVVVSGDEAKLLAQKTGCPVAIDPRRRRAAAFLIDEEGVDLILSDDGLQHLALPRAVEIIVVDGMRQFGNGRLLPAGPLRESKKRLANADFVITNGGQTPALPGPAAEGFQMAQHEQPSRQRKNRRHGLTAEGFQMAQHPRQLRHFTSGRHEPCDHLKGRPVHVNAALGNPQRLVEAVAAIGATPSLHAFPDHYIWRPGDFDFADDHPVVITEKDAVKCDFLHHRPAGERVWVLESEVEVDVKFAAHLMQRIDAYENGQLPA